MFYKITTIILLILTIIFGLLALRNANTLKCDYLGKDIDGSTVCKIIIIEADR